MNVHDDPSLDAELDRLRPVPVPRGQLREQILAKVAREAHASRPVRASPTLVSARVAQEAANAGEAIAQPARGTPHSAIASMPNPATGMEPTHSTIHVAAPARKLGERKAIHGQGTRAPSWRDVLAAFWRELGGARLAAPAFALALALGVGLSWVAEDGAAAADVSGDDLVALAQFDDAYEGLEP